MKNITILLFLSFFLTNCSKRETPFIDLFQKNDNLKYTLIDNLPELFLYHPIRMLIVKDLIIIADFKTNKIFHVINIKNSHYFQFGDKGRGPNELTDGYGLTSLSDTSFIVFDRRKEKVFFFSVIEDSVKMYQEIEVPQINNIVSYSESLFVTNGNFPFEKNYGVIDLKQNKVSSYIDYPGRDNEIFEGNQRKYYTHLIRKPSSFRFMGIKANHYIFDILELNIEGHLNLIDRKIYRHFDWEMLNGSPLPLDGNLNIFRAPRISASKERVFLCFQTDNEENQDWVLLTFDWDGNPLEKYTIPFIPYTITNVDDSTLYSVGLFGVDYKLCKIDLDSN